MNYFRKPEEYVITSATDVFSMGCVLFELLCDLPAFGRPEDLTLTHQQWRQQVLQRQALWVGYTAPIHVLLISCFNSVSIHLPFFYLRLWAGLHALAWYLLCLLRLSGRRHMLHFSADPKRNWSVLQELESAEGNPLPHGLDALRESVPDAEDCQQAVDLLQSLLQLEPSCRPSIPEALLHPFLLC